MKADLFFKLLHNTALKSPQSYQYVCAIEHEGKIISWGFNRYFRKYRLEQSCIL